MKLIPLTQGRVAFVDDEDFERVSIHKWHVDIARWNGYGEEHVLFYARHAVTPALRTIRLHQFILDHAGRIDHFDGNGLNNHATLKPEKWKGERLWIVALFGEIQDDGDKVGALKREILGEVTIGRCAAELNELLVRWIRRNG